MTRIIKGELEIDDERGVIYFHASPKESGFESITVLRICRLPHPMPTKEMMDITHMYDTSWGLNHVS